ncbi:class I SAM-dependent methyltransferase [Photobacterium sp. J15]|uniref:class I SAM-dependent methyltransferase n=1 Tax=Photobacterium sp. J15 TaxID=265901 RepID=UPI0007E3C479|nr:class I SAM-dependent methyltransferase [Photobacterium sp. J15]
MKYSEVSVQTFNKFAKEYQDKYMDYALYTVTYDNLIEYLPTNKTLSVLELGCGPANISNYLIKKDLSIDVFGIDLAPNMIQLAKENIPSGHFEIMDCREISCIKQKFELIICGFCTPYLSKMESKKLIQDTRNLLDDGGLLYLSAIVGNESLSGYQESSTGDRVYIHYHNDEFIADNLKESGFEVLDIEHKIFHREGHDPVTEMFIYAKAI